MGPLPLVSGSGAAWPLSSLMRACQNSLKMAARGGFFLLGGNGGARGGVPEVGREQGADGEESAARFAFSWIKIIGDER